MKAGQILLSRESGSTRLQSQTKLTHHVLLVEDNIAIRQASTELLLCTGYEVDSAEDGAAAWEALSANTYDLVITDNNMPRLSGVELLKKLRAARMGVLVVMATGTLPKEEFTRFPWLQPDATLLKPYTVAEFLGTVKAVLRATTIPSAQTGPPPNWQSEPSAVICSYDDFTTANPASSNRDGTSVPGGNGVNTP